MAVGMSVRRIADLPAVVAAGMSATGVVASAGHLRRLRCMVGSVIAFSAMAAAKHVEAAGTRLAESLATIALPTILLSRGSERPEGLLISAAGGIGARLGVASLREFIPLVGICRCALDLRPGIGCDRADGIRHTAVRVETGSIATNSAIGFWPCRHGWPHG